MAGDGKVKTMHIFRRIGEIFQDVCLALQMPSHFFRSQNTLESYCMVNIKKINQNNFSLLKTEVFYADYSSSYV